MESLLWRQKPYSRKHRSSVNIPLSNSVLTGYTSAIQKIMEEGFFHITGNTG